MTEPKSSASDETKRRFEELLASKKAKGGGDGHGADAASARPGRTDGPKGSRTFKRRKV